MDTFSKIKIGDKIAYKDGLSLIYTVLGYNDYNSGLIVENNDKEKIEIYRQNINDHYCILEDTNQEDNVSHPKHYTSHPSGIECIEITRHFCFSIGNAIKYLWRAGLKKDMSLTDKQKEIEDLKKAIWYINDRINQLQKT